MFFRENPGFHRNSPFLSVFSFGKSKYLPFGASWKCIEGWGSPRLFFRTSIFNSLMQIMYLYLRRLTLCYYELYYKSWFLKNSKTDHSWTTPISSSSIVVARSGHGGAKELIYWPKQNSESISRRLECATMKKEKHKIDKIKSWPISIQLLLFIRCWFYICILISFELTWKHTYNLDKLAEWKRFYQSRVSHFNMALSMKNPDWFHLPTQNFKTVIIIWGGYSPTDFRLAESQLSECQNQVL